MDPLCIEIVESSLIKKRNIRIDQIRFDIKVLFFSLDFGQKGQSGVLT